VRHVFVRSMQPAGTGTHSPAGGPLLAGLLSLTLFIPPYEARHSFKRSPMRYRQATAALMSTTAPIGSLCRICGGARLRQFRQQFIMTP
jgi:hypothetical protein